MDRPGTGRMASGGIARPSTATKQSQAFRPGTGVRVGTGRLTTASGLGGASVVRLQPSIASHYPILIYLILI